MTELEEAIGAIMADVSMGDIPTCAGRDAVLSLIDATVKHSADLTQHVRDFLRALDRGYLDCKDDSAFIDALREAVAK